MITINGKAYKASEKAEWYINDLIKYGDLEEWRDNVFKSDEVPFGEQSILEKLREWVDKELKLQGYEHQEILDRIDDLSTSLENSSEIPNSSPISKMETTQFTPGQEDFSELPKINDTNLLEDVCVWTPKPGQEIEVSDDGIDWVQGRFVSMYGSKYRVDNTSDDFPSMRTYWYNARPIEDKIELLPAYEPSEPDWRDTQISLLTRTVNQLISK